MTALFAPVIPLTNVCPRRQQPSLNYKGHKRIRRNQRLNRLIRSFHFFPVEVHQSCDLQPSRYLASQPLGLVNGLHLLETLPFDNRLGLDKTLHSESTIELKTLGLHGQFKLESKDDFVANQFMGQVQFIVRVAQSGAEVTLSLVGINDSPIQKLGDFPLRALAVLRGYDLSVGLL